MKFSLINLFSLVTIVALAISLVMVLISKDPVVIVNSDDDNFSWEFRQQLLKASPAWPEDQKNPPLSTRDAIRIADDICDNLNSESKKLKINSWRFDQISLLQLNAGFRDSRTKNSRTKWCYIVHFRSYKLYPTNSETVAFMILMDGTVFVAESPWLNVELEKKLRQTYGQED